MRVSACRCILVVVTALPGSCHHFWRGYGEDQSAQPETSGTSHPSPRVHEVVGCTRRITVTHHTCMMLAFQPRVASHRSTQILVIASCALCSIRAGSFVYSLMFVPPSIPTLAASAHSWTCNALQRVILQFMSLAVQLGPQKVLAGRQGANHKYQHFEGSYKGNIVGAKKKKTAESCTVLYR